MEEGSCSRAPLPDALLGCSCIKYDHTVLSVLIKTLQKSGLETFQDVIIVGAAVSKTNRSLSVFLRVATTKNTGQNTSLYTHLVIMIIIMDNNGNMKADRNAEMCSFL